MHIGNLKKNANPYKTILLRFLILGPFPKYNYYLLSPAECKLVPQRWPKNVKNPLKNYRQTIFSEESKEGRRREC